MTKASAPASGRSELAGYESGQDHLALPAMRHKLLERFPDLIITDTIGSSEPGAQMNLATNQADGATIFTPGRVLLSLMTIAHACWSPRTTERAGWANPAGATRLPRRCPEDHRTNLSGPGRHPLRSVRRPGSPPARWAD